MTQYEYDALNRQTVISDAEGVKTIKTYDGVGNIIAQQRGVLPGYGLAPYGTSPYGSPSTAVYFHYDGVSRLTNMSNGVGDKVYFYYDTNRNRTEVTNDLDHTIYFGYDELNRLTKIQDALAETTYFEFDAVGNRTKVIDANDR